MSTPSILRVHQTEACRDRLIELAEHHRISNPNLSENNYLTIRLLQSFAGAYYGIGHFGAMHDVVRSDTHSLSDSLGNQPLNCAIIGEFSAGKSSLINALVGRDDFLPVNLTETTALISKLEYAPFPRVELEMRDGSRRESSIEDYRKLVDQNSDSSLRQQVALVRALVDYPPLRKISIFDTPGLNSKIEEHERTTMQYISKVDVVFWVFKANQPVAGSELKYLETIKNHGRPVYAVINKIDAVRGFGKNQDKWNEEMSQIMDVFHKYCSGVIEKFIPMSALEALRGMAANDREQLERSNIGELRKVIEDEIAGRTEKIKQERLATTVSHYAGLSKATEKYMQELFMPLSMSLKPLRERLDLIEQEAIAFTIDNKKKNINTIKKPWL